MNNLNYGCHWDWFTFVFKLPSPDKICNLDSEVPYINQALKFVKQKLKLDDASFATGSGLRSYHYECSQVLSGENSIIIGFNFDYKMNDTIMVQMSGSGYGFWLRYLELKGYDVYKIERDIVLDTKLPMKPSRVDVAMDLYNFGNHFSPMYVNEVTQQGLYVGRSKPTWVHSYNPHGAIKDSSKYSTSKEGSTLYFGQGNQKQLRIYNKKAERFSKKSQMYDCHSWYRWEFELHGQSALDFWDLYLDQSQNITKAWRYWLSSNYRWITKIGKPQKKISRYPNADFYDVLIQDFKHAKPIKHQREPDAYERTKAFVDNQTLNAQMKLIAHDIIKYQKNGVNYDDAVKYAKSNLLSKIDERLKMNDVNFDVVANYFINENDNESAKEAERLDVERKEHIDGI